MVLLKVCIFMYVFYSQMPGMSTPVNTYIILLFRFFHSWLFDEILRIQWIHNISLRMPQIEALVASGKGLSGLMTVFLWLSTYDHSKWIILMI